MRKLHRGTGETADGGTLDRGREARKVLAMAAGLHRRGDLAHAIDGYGHALMLDPRSAETYNNLGVALRTTGRAEAAVVAYRRALALGPDNPGTWSNLGNALRDLGRYAESVAAHRRAADLASEAPETLFNLGLALRDLGRLGEALSLFDKVLALRPGHADYLWDRALTLLQIGDYEQGFRQYEARWGLDRAVKRTFDRPRWDGGPLEGKTLFLHQEQGYGDMIQFARFAPLVKERFGGRVVLECQPEMERLFRSLKGVDAVVSRPDRTPPFDVFLPLLSLPRVLDVTLGGLPNAVPYLFPPERGHVRLRAADNVRLRVGLVWAGKMTPKDRSCPLEGLIEMLGEVDIAAYSLQRDERAKDLARLSCPALIADIGPRMRDFADTAEVLSQLDLVITIDSAVAHLAGAMGRPVWTLLLYASDWRWLEGRSDSPWYPTMRLFRQHRPNDWTRVFEQVKTALDELLIQRRGAASTSTTPAD